MRTILPEKYFSSSDLEGEKWLEIFDWKGHDLKYPYWISNRGRIKNADKDLLAGQEDRGYHQIQLSFVDKDRPIPVHQLVLTLFKGPPPDSMVDPTVNHIDHVRLNNSIDNLEWMSRSDNGKDGSLLSYPVNKMHIRIDTQDGQHIEFDDQGDAEHYLHSNQGYISACMHSGVPILDQSNKEVILWYMKCRSEQWEQYTPVRLPQRQRRLCTIVDKQGIHLFNSPAEGSRYLHQTTYYLSNQHEYGKHIALNAANGEEVTFTITYPKYFSETLLNCTKYKLETNDEPAEA